MIGGYDDIVVSQSEYKSTQLIFLPVFLFRFRASCPPSPRRNYYPTVPRSTADSLMNSSSRVYTGTDHQDFDLEELVNLEQTCVPFFHQSENRSRGGCKKTLTDSLHLTKQVLYGGIRRRIRARPPSRTHRGTRSRRREGLRALGRARLLRRRG